MRRVITALLRLLARIFFRRIEIVGIENIPAGAPVIFAVNHPNGLIDPLFLLCFAPRRVSLLAKAPLFTMPVIGAIVRALDTIPVYRKQDHVAGSNRETFARARDVLARGGAIAIFPEGTTHSDSKLRELKSGAARIALGASMTKIFIVPAGLYYSAKQTFRSSAAMELGEPIAVRPEMVDENGEPPATAVDGLTRRIEQGLAEVTLQAESRQALDLIARAERVFSAGKADVVEEREIRRRFIDGYAWLRERDPARLQRLVSMLERLEAELDAASVDPEQLAPPTVGGSIRALAWLLIGMPLAIAGAIIHYPAYRLVGFISTHFTKEEELTATLKAIGGAVFFPLTWIVCASAVWWRYGGRAAGLAIIVLPIVGYVGLRFFEQLDDVIGGARALLWRVARRKAFERFREERRRLKEEVWSAATVPPLSLP